MSSREGPMQVPPEPRLFHTLAMQDISTALATPEALDDYMPGVLEEKSLLSMTHLWDASTWARHKSRHRWAHMLVAWPHSSILRAIRLPLGVILLVTLAVLQINALLAEAGRPRLTLPLAPLSLQASSLGLLLVFRNNQTHERLKEAQKAMGGLGALAREIMQLLVVHVPPEKGRAVALAARLLALFGWALKMQCRNEPERLYPIAEVLLPRAHSWLLSRPHRPGTVLLRLRAVVGELRKDGLLSSDAFKFIEERLAKLSAADAACVRLATFPVPPSYHRHGSRAIVLWLGSLPFVMEGLGCHPLQTAVAVMCTTFLLLGIDQIAIEVEQPLDVLPLHEFARGMSNDVHDVLEAWTTMPAVPRACDDYSDLGKESYLGSGRSSSARGSTAAVDKKER